MECYTNENIPFLVFFVNTLDKEMLNLKKFPWKLRLLRQTRYAGDVLQ